MDLSVIVLSYNTKDITDKCLSNLQLSVQSCQKKLNNKIEVIVVDNASTDDSVEMIESKHKWVKLIKPKTNTGYSGGNNIGLKKSTKPYILLLNSDAFIEEDTLVKALDYFQTHPDCDVLGGKLIYDNGTLQPSAGNLPTPLNTIFWILGISFINSFHPTYKDYFSKDQQVGWTSGAFFMFKRRVYENVGGFDEDIFMYMDEVDLCKRISNAHFKVCFTPSMVITHLHKASSKDFPEKALTNELKGIKVYFKKYYPGNYWLVKMFLILGLILRVIAFSLLGKTQRARAYVGGLSVI